MGNEFVPPLAAYISGLDRAKEGYEVKHSMDNNDKMENSTDNNDELRNDTDNGNETKSGIDNNNETKSGTENSNEMKSGIDNNNEMKNGTECSEEMSNRSRGKNARSSKNKPKGKKENYAFSGLWILHLLQHAALTIAAVLAIYLVQQSTLWIETDKGVNWIFPLYQEDIETEYEQSQMINELLESEISEVVSLSNLRSKMENYGRFDGERVVDVTAYFNHYNGIDDQYITAHYYLGDMLKWSQRGFYFYDRSFTEAEAAEFLNGSDYFTATTGKVLPDNESINESDGDWWGIYSTVVPSGTVSGNDFESFHVYNTPEGEFYDMEIKETTFDVNGVDPVQLEADYTDYIDSVYSVNEGPAGNQGYEDDYTIQYADQYGNVYTDQYGNVYTDQYGNVYTDEYGNVYEDEYGGEYEEDVADDTDIVTVLENYYQTIDGQNIEDRVGSWVTYRELCNNIEAVAQMIGSDYAQYTDYLTRYDGNNSNLGYYIAKRIGTQTEVFSNLPELDDGEKIKSAEELSVAFADRYEGYIYYDPINLQFETNLAVSEGFMQGLLNDHQLYADDSRIFIGVDTDYPVADPLYYGHDGFEKYVPNFFRLPIAVLLCLLSWFLLVITLTGQTGRAVDHEGRRFIRLRSYDRFPTELTAALAVGIIFGIFALVEGLILGMSRDLFYHEWFLPISGIGVFVLSVIISQIYYSFVRRIKARSLWRDSMSRTVCRGVVKGGRVMMVAFRRMANYANDNWSLVLRVILPLTGLVLLHCILLVIGAVMDYNGGMRIFTDVIIFLVDLVVAALLFMSADNRAQIVSVINRISSGELKAKANEEKLYGGNRQLAQAVNRIGDSISSAVEISMRDERMKADLITNVSHDIKTPLTSIINYVDLLKRENIADEKVKEYIAVLDAKSQRLKQLTDDLVEASKISSGNITLQWENINLTELVNQTAGEFSEKFNERQLTVNINAQRPQLMINADSRRVWRVMENLFINVYKYALSGTRVYIDLQETGQGQVMLVIKNISSQPLAVSVVELTERFIRGDVSRSTEGSGLGLSIAKSLTEAQNGRFEIVIDGDLFKVILVFPMLEQV
ncbi:MAG: HAMP domain-containing histidine kinase [Lachnospiraceae bacterium]|jgi:signal transduction histidine kinase|nr:HAMP domain-containing histidine kinase [Lachnospiraceae bacterium]